MVKCIVCLNCKNRKGDVLQDKYVMNPITKEELLDIMDENANDIIKYFIKKSLFSQPEILPEQTPRAAQIPKEHIEQWFVQALGATPRGAGSYPIDIYDVDKGWAADIKMLNAKVLSNGKLADADSGEASLGQDFKSAGVDLDSLFNTGKFEKIRELWLDIIRKKERKVLKEIPGIKHIKYLFILRAENSFYLVGCNLDGNQLSNTSVDKTTKTSVFLRGMIDPALGNTKIYKSKKRLELRLRPKEWIERGLFIEFKTNFSPYKANLSQIDDLDLFLESQFNKIKNINIEIS